MDAEPRQWLQRLHAWQHSAVSLLDVRELTPYCERHLRGGAHIPRSQLLRRRHELPPAGSALVLLTDEDRDDSALALASWGYSVVDVWHTAPSLWHAAESLHVQKDGPGSVPLWSPCDLLAEYLAPSPAPGRALDLACGAGRDALYLAQHGWQVQAVDISADALERVQISARANRVTVHTEQLDLEHGDHTPQGSPWDLIVVVRYLHRPLLPRLREWLKPGGVLLYQTFLQGAEKFGSPRRAEFLLAPGELAQHFADFDVLVDRQDHLPDGRPVNSFLARKLD